MKPALLHLEVPDSDADISGMIFKLKGDGVTLSKMVSHAMDTDTNVSTLFITAVLGWAHERNVPFDRLETIYKKNKP